MINSSKTIAVLPFVNMSGNDETEYFSDGITEEIINALAKIRDLKVTSRTSSFFFKGKNLPIQQIGKDLNVSTILEGSVRLAGNTMRITAQLIQAEDDFHFWSETWDRKLENVFEVQDEISLLIADKLREHFGHLEIQEHLVTPRTKSVDAYSYSLKAHYLRNKWNPEDVTSAIELYQKAIALDPNHTSSLMGLADSYSFLAMTGFMDFMEAWALTSKYIEQSLAIDTQIPEAYYQLANHAIFTECDFSKAMENAKKSVQIQPNYVEGQQFLCFLYLIAGEEKLARKHLKIALEINPLSQETWFYEAYVDYMSGQYAKSLTKLKECLNANPNSIPAICVKSQSLIKVGRQNEVIQLFDELPSEITIESEKTGSLALAYSALHEKNKTEKYFQLLQEQGQGPNGFTASSYIYLFYGFTENIDAAFNWVEDAWNNKSPLLLLRFNDPIAHTIKNDSRYLKYQNLLYPKHLLKSVSSTKKPLLDENGKNEYTQRLNELIQTEKPYLDSSLTLRSLAEMINIHPNQLSWLLNESLGKNFSEYINHFRVEKFKSLAQDSSKKHITLIGLAYESGFNSKTVFNTYFKKETGLTPKQFLSNN